MARTIVPLRYHGGKSQLAKKHVIYEPKNYRLFGDACVGGGSYLCVRDRPGVSEYANDMYGELTNFFRVLQDDRLYSILENRLLATPFSQSEYDRAKKHPRGPWLVPDVDAAHAFFVRNRQSRQALEKDFATRSFRLRRERNEQTSSWNSAIYSLKPFRDRLRWVEIREMDIIDFIDLIDSPHTFFYVDPPYLADTRVAGKYAVEMPLPKHLELLRRLQSIEGKFMLCGYDSSVYRSYELMNMWKRVEFPVSKSSSSAKTKPKTTEVIWMNY